jgi:glutamate racemase
MIGVYDSGVGGLTVLDFLRDRMPFADIVYLGDTVNLPYGSKPPAFLRERAEGAFDFFKRMNASLLIVACGTISTVVLESAPSSCRFPLLGVARPAVERLQGLGCKKIAILATEASIASGIYERLLARRGVKTLALPCPSFVPLAESGIAPSEDPQITDAVRHALAPLDRFSPDAILLGCTHFSLLGKIIRSLYPYADVVDCSKEVADTVDSERYGKGQGSTSFYVTGSPDAFFRSAQPISDKFRHLTVHQITL